MKTLVFSRKARVFFGLMTALAIAGISPARAGVKPAENVPQPVMADQVRHQLVMLPYFNVFDNLQFEIRDDNTVVLSGQVTRPILKSDAANVVRRVEGVSNVVNNIEVLPLSRFDDRIRLALYRTLFSNPQLDRYALQAVPPIHIIVKNGNVTLVGVVASQADKNVAGILANGVPGTFKITNDLRVENKS